MLAQSFPVPTTEGFVDVGGYHVFARWAGRSPTEAGDVLVVLNGGPGAPHEYLAPLAALADDARCVLFYDPFAVGRSDGHVPGDFDRYTIRHFVRELESLREALGIRSMSLLGHSCGTHVLFEYALDHPERVHALVSSNGIHDVPMAFAAMRAAFEKTLTAEERKAAEEMEARRDFDNPEYEALFAKVAREHLARRKHLPDGKLPLVAREAFGRMNREMYGVMWGPNEFVMHETARLREWSVRDRLHEIRASALVVTGEHDEIDPAVARDMADRLPDAQLVVLEDCSHMPFYEKPEEYLAAVRAFLDRSTAVSSTAGTASPSAGGTSRRSTPTSRSGSSGRGAPYRTD